MKKLFFFVLLLVLFSCLQNTEYSLISDGHQPQYKNISDYYYLGSIHNQYIENVCLNFNERKSLNRTDAISYVTQFHCAFISEDTVFSYLLNQEFNKNHQKLKILHHDSLKNYVNDFVNLLDLALNLKIIDKWEHDLFYEILKISREDIDFQFLDNYIENKIVEWNNRKYLRNSIYGDLRGSILGIAKLSTNWWINNNCDQSSNNERIAPWVAADIIGGIVGMGLHMASHAASNGGSLDGCCGDGIAVSMVAGAVMGSTGIVGRAGRAFSRWFNNP